MILTVNNLTFTYPGGDAPAVHDLDFEVEEGEVFGFLGPSGAGKSTTQNILIGLLKGWSGEINVLGKPLQEWRADYYRSIGVSFELPNHYLKLTARENLEYFRALHDGNAEKVEDVMAMVGLEDHADKVVGAFSKGMKNRLNFARSLLHRPKMWFLDEPTSGLDPVNAVRIRELIRDRQQKGCTTLVTTHDMVTADLVCDRIAFIVDGQIAAIDSPTALKRRYGKREVEVTWSDEEGGEEQSESFSLEGLADNEAFDKALRHPQLLSIHSQEATLESVFMQVTGRSLQ